MSLLDTVEELMRDICEIDEPDDCDGVVRVKLDWLRPKVESLLSQCRKEALLEAIAIVEANILPRLILSELRRMAESDKTTMEGEK